MIRSSAFISLIVVAASGVWLLGELSFLAPWRVLLVHKYAPYIAAFVALITINLFGAILAVNRRLFLRDTGRKLAHVEKQLRTGSTISDELTKRLDA